MAHRGHHGAAALGLALAVCLSPAARAQTAPAVQTTLPEAKPSWLDDLCQKANAWACLERGVILANARQDDPALHHLWFGCASGDEPDGCVHVESLARQNRGAGLDLARERARLTGLCDTNDARGCLALGHMLMLGIGGPKDSHQARTRYQRACDTDPWTCAGLAWQREAARDLAQAAVLYARACAAGNLARGCRSHAAMLERGAGIKANRAAAAKVRENACQAGDGVSCWRLGESRSGAQALELETRACSLGVVAGCVAAGRLQKGHVVEEGQLLGLACFADQACREFAAVVAARSAKAALPVYENTCGKGDASACVEGAMLAGEGGADLAADVARARGLMEKACALKQPDGCGMAGVMLIQGMGGAADGAKGLAYIQQACEAGRAASCGDLGLVYLQGLGGLKADAARGKTLLEQGCKAGHTQSCEAVKVLAQAPAQPPAKKNFYAEARENERLAHAAAAACDARPEKVTCAEAGRRYLRPSAFLIPTDKERAIRYFGKACEAGDGPSCVEAASGAAFKSPERGRLLQRACDLGAGDGCTRAADELPGDDARRGALYEKGCALNDGSGCFLASAMVAKTPEAAVAFLRKACDLKDPNGCRYLADHLATGDGVTRDVAEARRLYEAACKYFGDKDASCAKLQQLK